MRAPRRLRRTSSSTSFSTSTSSFSSTSSSTSTSIFFSPACSTSSFLTSSSTPSSAQALLPQLCLDDQEKPPPRLLPDDELIQLTIGFSKIWPFVPLSKEKPLRMGGDYTGMDVGRLMYLAGVTQGVIEPAPLSAKAFAKLLKLQGGSVRNFAQTIGFDYGAYLTLHSLLAYKAIP